MRPSARVPIACAVAAALIALPAAATGAPRLRSAGPATGPGAASGSLLVFPLPSPHIRVRDLSAGTSRDVVLPHGCAYVDHSHGRALLRCGAPGGERYAYLDLAGNELREIPSANYDPAFDSFGELGARWASGMSCSAHCRTVFLDVLSGAVRAAEPSRRAGVPDPDSASLRRLRPCRYVSDPGRIDRRASVAQRGDRLVLYRCARRAATLGRCRTGCTALAFAGGRVAWLDAGRLWLYRVATRARRSWRLPVDVVTATYSPRVELGRRHAVVSAPVAAGGPEPFRIFFVRAPRR